METNDVKIGWNCESDKNNLKYKTKIPTGA